MKLYRAMKVAADGLPEVGSKANRLGVRLGDQVPNSDVEAIAPDDLVVPGTGGGMSVAPRDPVNLPRHRRPAAFGGTGKEPVWVLDEADLPAELTYQPDPGKDPKHGLIVPSQTIRLAAYQQALESTRGKWQLVLSPANGGQQ